MLISYLFKKYFDTAIEKLKSFFGFHPFKLIGVWTTEQVGTGQHT
jgi:hypothetical protein